MDELLATFEEFGEALKSLQEVPRELVEQFKAFSAAIAPATNAIGRVSSALGDKLQAGLGIAADALFKLDQAIATALPVVVSALGTGLATVVRQVSAEFAALGAGIKNVLPLFAQLGGVALARTFEALTTTVGATTSALGTVSKGMLALATGPISLLATGIQRAFGSVTTGNVAAVLGGLTGAILGPFQQLSAVVAPFVQALNPGLMKVFNQALRDLMATFGVAFAPVIQHVAALFNELSATLAPAMRALAPILDNLMSVLEGSLVPVVGIIADAFVALAPVIELVASVMASMSEAMRVFITVFRSALDVVWKVFQQFVGGVDLKGAAEGIRDVIQQLTKYFVQFAAYVAKALGYLDPFANALKKNLEDLKGQKPGVKAAPENVHVTGLEQISKDLAVAAFAAQQAGGPRKKSEAEFLEELFKSVEEVRRNGKTLTQFLTEIKERLDKTLQVAMSGVVDAVWEQLKAKLKEWWTGEKPPQQLPDPHRGIDQRAPRNFGNV